MVRGRYVRERVRKKEKGLEQDEKLNQGKRNEGKPVRNTNSIVLQRAGAFCRGESVVHVQQQAGAHRPERGQFLGHPVHPGHANGPKQGQDKNPRAAALICTRC